MTEFPFDIFTPEIRQNILHIATKHNIPTQFMGCASLISIAGLAGNMYRLRTDQGIIKPNLFMAMVAPSGVGKTPSYQSLCGRPTAKMRFEKHNEWKAEVKAWRTQHGKDLTKGESVPDQPKEILRMFEEGTAESIEDALTYCRAGLTLIYDEGQKFFTSAMAYNKDANADGFWNDLYEGNTTYRHRVKEELRRFIPDPCVSVLIGLQTERMIKYFTQDTLYSGIFNRFLFVFSKRIQLNGDINLFSENGHVHEDWRNKITTLFHRGFKYDPDNEFSTCKTIWVQVDPEAVGDFDTMRKLFIHESNQYNLVAQDGEASGFMAAYDSKLYKCFMKFCIILAVLDDHYSPVIRKKNIYDAERLYRFFRAGVVEFLADLVDTDQTGLSKKERVFFNLLPDFFGAEHIKKITDDLGVNPGFFKNMLSKKLLGKKVRKISGMNNYEKL